MTERVFVQLTETHGGNVWIDVDQIIAVREEGGHTFVYVLGLDLMAMVTETGAEVMDRMADAVSQAMATT